MKIIYLCLIVFILPFITPQTAQAIILLPALVLIPIAKIISLIIGALLFPFVGGVAVWGKISQKPVYKMIAVSIVLLIVVGIVLALGLKLSNPDRPWI
jgi:hypothetical protein